MRKISKFQYINCKMNNVNWNFYKTLCRRHQQVHGKATNETIDRETKKKKQNFILNSDTKNTIIIQI